MFMSAGELSRKEIEANPETALEALVEPFANSELQAPSFSVVEPAPMEPRAAASHADCDPDAWQVISVLSRLDAETLSMLMTDIHECLATGARRIALDLTKNEFFSLNAIQLCVGLARDLDADEGRLALVGCGERTKKHFDVYGSLKQITVVRTLAELVAGNASSLVIRPRFSRSQP